MLNKIREFFLNTQTWILLVIFFIGIGIAFAGVAKLPEKVSKVEEKIDKTDDKVQELASNVDKYVALNTEQRIGQEKREELMLKLIEGMKDR